MQTNPHQTPALERVAPTGQATRYMEGESYSKPVTKGRKSEVAMVTPAMAQRWLEILANSPEANKNRLSPQAERAHVNRLVALIKSGKWDLTHQGFLIGADDLLLDGRHRALAIVKAGVTVPVEITYDPAKRRAVDLHGVDANMATRSYAFMTGLDEKLASAARFLINFIMKGPPTAEQIAEVGFEMQPYWELIREQVKKNKRTWNAAHFISAFMLRLAAAEKPEEREELVRIYDALSQNDPKALPPLVYSFYRQHAESPMRQQDGFVKLWRALDPADRGTLTRLQFRDISFTTQQLRKTVLERFPSTKPLYV